MRAFEENQSNLRRAKILPEHRFPAVPPPPYQMPASGIITRLPSNRRSVLSEAKIRSERGGKDGKLWFYFRWKGRKRLRESTLGMIFARRKAGITKENPAEVDRREKINLNQKVLTNLLIRPPPIHKLQVGGIGNIFNGRGKNNFRIFSGKKYQVFSLSGRQTGKQKL
jgi:hypothetical protein